MPTKHTVLSKLETVNRKPVFDLLKLLIAFGILRILNFIADFIPYAKQGFFCDDEEIRYPTGSDTVPSRVMDVFHIIVAVLLIVIVEWFLLRQVTVGQLRRLHFREDSILHPLVYNIFFILLSLLCAYSATNVLITMGKRTVSRLRPDFIAVCQPDLETLCPLNDRHIFVENYKCYGETMDEFASFPSGHSGAAAAFAVFMIYYLHKRCRYAQPLAAFAQFALAFFALFICFSRVRDRKHRITDVYAGALIGATVSVFVTHFVLRGFREQRYDTDAYEQLEDGNVDAEYDKHVSMHI